MKLRSSTSERPTGIYMTDGPVKFVPLDTERLARMASVDGQWWQEMEPGRRRCSIALWCLVPSGIGWLIICGLTYAALVALP